MAAMAERLLSIDQARTVVLDATGSLPAETVRVDDALGRVLAEDVLAQNDVQPFDNSAMDGFVVVPGGAGRRLAVVGESRAGAPADRSPGEGEALRVSTGAVVPDAELGVLPVENADVDGDVLVTRAATTPGQHIRRAGEDMRKGAIVLTAGTTLGPAELGVAVTAGRAEVRVARRPRVAIVVTGDELVPPGAPLAPGQIHESNSVTLAALAKRAGAKVAVHPSVADTGEATRKAFEGALAAADVVIASGGVSVGPHDEVKGALAALGVEQRFWRVALRPGKPTWFGTREDQLVFGLPGNPVSAMVTFLLFARPALLELQGADPDATRVTARLTEDVERLPNRDEAVRVRLREGASGREATPTGPQGSHQLTSMVGAGGLAIVTAGDGAVTAGDAVTVELISG
jgi:molybdopterin molybdotransferase